ncbi:hypothetical protein ACA910_009657 [Epithemia clementina (nom. ined.)]
MDVMETPVAVRTQCDGVDLVFMKDGYVRISVRYRLFLLRYNASGMPMDCTFPDLMDLLLHFSKEQELPATSDDDSLSSNFPDNDSVIDLEDEDNVAAMKGKSGHHSVNTVESSLDESPEVIATPPKRRRVVAGTSDTLFLNLGTCFRLLEHDSVSKIVAIQSDTVSAELINPGCDLTVEKGAVRQYDISSPVLLQVLKNYNK